MKQIIFYFFAMVWMLSACGGNSAQSSKEVVIAQNEQGYYGLKQGSKWIAEPVYTKLIVWECEAGKFFIAHKVPSTQKYYHVIFDSSGKLLKEGNIYNYSPEGNLWFITPNEPSSALELKTMKEHVFQ